MGRDQLEDLWRVRVANAKVRYDTAHHHLKASRHSPECADAIRVESAAQADYLRVLRLFTCVLEGRTLDEKEWLRRGAAGAA